MNLIPIISDDAYKEFIYNILRSKESNEIRYDKLTTFINENFMLKMLPEILMIAKNKQIDENENCPYCQKIKLMNKTILENKIREYALLLSEDVREEFLKSVLESDLFK